MTAFRSVLISVCLLVPAVPAVSDELPEVLRVEENTGRTVAVPKWDPASPQELVRVDGALYQKEGDLLYPVLDERITVRLADGIESWNELLTRAAVVSPGSFEELADLQPLRVNKLGIVDLVAPAERDVTEWCDLVFSTGLVRYAEVGTRGTYIAAPNDPQYVEQYALNNTGQTGGTAGADMDVDSAWDITAGDPSIVVAVLDSGTDIDHEDLAANTWHNSGETPGNGQDDDGNGFVDDWEGWDFGSGDNDPRPFFYHGTHVTGIINAVTDNGLGISGIAGGFGGPGVQAMAVAVGASSPNADVVDDAIIYAADNGAHIISTSLLISESQAINDALDYAYNVKGVFINGASGNSASSTVGYPARRPEVVAVGSTDHNDVRSSFSNYGDDLEVTAPGTDIRSTQPGDDYSESSGTSFASPQVAGVAALVLSLNPGLPVDVLRQLLIDTADDINDPGWDPQTGHGRINAYAAVLAAQTSDGGISLDASAYACGNTVQVTVFDADLAGAGSIAISIGSETESGGESLILNELGASSGAFRGAITTATTVPLNDGVLQVSSGDTITAEYVDANDGQGGSNVLKTATAAADCFGPVIVDVTGENHQDTSVDITWATDEASTSVVRFGATVPPAQQVQSGGLVQLHTVPLGGLTSCTPYLYEVESTDGVGHTTIDNAGGVYHEVVTWGDFPGVGLAPCTIGQIDLDKQQDYACDDTAQVTVIDLDLDTDPNVVETVQVQLTSTSEPGGEWITLTETSVRNTRFVGSLALDPGPAVAGDGKLAMSSGDLITATYFDADDGSGQTQTVAAVSDADCSGPVITNIQVTNVLDNRATVEWTTSEPATSRVDFGPTPGFGNVAEDLTLRTSHSVAISPFDGCDRVHFRVSGADGNGNVGTGPTLGFNLGQIGGLVYREGFETDTGWTLEGSWERGAPQGLGSGSGDPDSAWSGANVIGNDLSGQGAIPGDYETGANESAISPVFSTIGHHNLELIFQRKLGLTSLDYGRIFVHHDGQSTTAQTFSGSFNDSQWTEYRQDISAWADDKASVQLQFQLRAVTPQTSYGWNIDEIIVKDSTAPDFDVCGGCGGGPGFAGASSVVDPDPCGAGGLVVSWDAAASWGTGTDGTYDVYRGTTPSFVPDVSNRVATGLTGTSWTDTTAPVDTPVWYVVRARNNESCTGGEGIDDGNLVRLEGTETIAQSPPAPVGSTVMGMRVGNAHVRLEWDAVAGADHYVVRRATQFDFSDAVDVGTTPGTVFEDVNAAIAPDAYIYGVFTVNACGQE